MAFTFVVVYLKRPKKFIVIKDFWVQGLCNAKLKNNGCNSNQDFLVFWAAQNDIALNVQPDFSMPLSSRYEPTTDGICYIARVKKFFGKIFFLVFNFLEHFCFMVKISYLYFIDNLYIHFTHIFFHF